MRTQAKSDRLGLLKDEAAAHVTNNNLIRKGITLESKKFTATQALEKKIYALNSAYGTSNSELRESAAKMTNNKQEADRFVESITKAKQRMIGLKKSIAKASDAKGLKALSRETNELAIDTQRLNSKLREQAKVMNASKFAANSLSGSMKNMARSYVSVFALAAGGAASLNLGQNLIAAKATLLGASGDAKQAGEDFEFLIQTSERLGTSLRESVSGYAKIGAAARSAGLGVSESRNMFLAAQETAAAFQLSADDTSGVQRAFAQILAKGKLSTEELLQLGERIPITFQAAADAMNMKTPELLKQIESGKLMSVDFLPNFADKMREYVRESGQLEESLKTSQRAMGRFKQAFEQGVLAAFDSGIEGGLADFFKDLTVSMKKMTPVFQFVGKVFGGLFDIVGSLIRALVQVSPLLFLLGDKGTEAMEGMNGELTKTVELIDLVVGGLKFIVGGLILIPALMDRLERTIGTLPSMEEQLGNGSLTSIKSGMFARPDLHKDVAGGASNKTTTINIQANDVGHVAQIVKDTLQEDLTLNYGV